MNLLKKDIEHLGLKMDDHEEALSKDIDRLEQKIDDFIKGAPKRFAAKPAEWIIYGLAVLALTYTVNNLLNLL